MSRAFGLIVVTGIAKENAAMQNGALTISAVGNNKLRYEALRSVHAASLSDDGSSYFRVQFRPDWGFNRFRARGREDRS